MMQANTSTSGAATVARWLLAAALAFAGVNHFTNAGEFLAQVPPWMPWPEAVVAVSGVIELTLAGALVIARQHRVAVGWVVAAFFVVIFPGNISQFVTGTDAFGLDSDGARAVRLLFQPLLVVWALWCTGAWRHWRQARQTHQSQHRSASTSGQRP
jgi:uncharacterized membrane protein